jgi:hypothetical protein
MTDEALRECKPMSTPIPTSPNLFQFMLKSVRQIHGGHPGAIVQEKAKLGTKRRFRE